jgi:ribulose-phosphate 3-epimerase
VTIRLAPSILSADFSRLADGIAEAEEGGADWIHVDVMDGHFVPNLTIGPPVVRAIRKVTQLPLDVHLMIEAPERFIDAFADAGADILTVHQEASIHLHRTVEAIRERGMRPGVAINPGTPASALDEILSYIELVLVMSVNPGFGGQRYVPTSTAKIARVRKELEARSLWGVELEVDGGIGPATIAEVVDAGATVLVAGAAVYNQQGTVSQNLANLRSAAASHPSSSA